MRTPLPTRESAPSLWHRPPEYRGHVPVPRNPKPMNGGRGGLGWVPRTVRAQGGGGGGFLEQNGVFVPLQYTSAADPLEGG